MRPGSLVQFLHGYRLWPTPSLHDNSTLTFTGTPMVRKDDVGIVLTSDDAVKSLRAFVLTQYGVGYVARSAIAA